MHHALPWPLLSQLLTTLPLCGVIWMVQLVVYPQFANVGADQFARYHRFHSSRITLIVAPLMLGEIMGAAAMVMQAQSRHAIDGGGGLGWALLGLSLAISAWALTGLVAVPAHNVLARGFTGEAYRRLMFANVARTVVWSARAGLVSYWLVASQGVA